MYQIIKGDTRNPLNPTKIVMRGKSVLQLAFAELFRKSGMGIASRNILRSATGDEIQTFHDSLIGESMRKKQVRFRTYRGDDILVPTERVIDPINPAKELVEIVKEYIAEAYILLATANPEVSFTIRKIQSSSSSEVLFVSDKPEENTSSFLYDKPASTSTSVASGAAAPAPAYRVFNQVLKTLALPDIVAPVERLTPTTIQENLFSAVEEQFKLKWDPATNKFILLLTPDKLPKLMPPLIMSNRGFIRAKYPDMILPDTAPFRIIKLIESIGKNISEKTASGEVQVEEVRLGEALSVEEAEALETLTAKMKKTGATIDVSFVTDTNGYELKSFLTFGKTRIELIPI